MNEASSRRHILLVEDDEAQARLVKWHLEWSGFEVHAETNGRKALLYAAERRPDLVVLDLMLPDMTGYEVCRELRRIYRPWTIPVVMLTGLDKPIDQLRGFASGSDVYLTKPCDPEELIRTVAALLDGRMAA